MNKAFQMVVLQIIVYISISFPNITEHIDTNSIDSLCHKLNMLKFDSIRPYFDKECRYYSIKLTTRNLDNTEVEREIVLYDSIYKKQPCMIEQFWDKYRYRENYPSVRGIRYKHDISKRFIYIATAKGTRKYQITGDFGSQEISRILNAVNLNRIKVDSISDIIKYSSLKEDNIVSFDLGYCISEYSMNWVDDKNLYNTANFDFLNEYIVIRKDKPRKGCSKR